MARILTLAVISFTVFLFSCGVSVSQQITNVARPATTFDAAYALWRNGVSWFEMEKSEQRLLTEYLKQSIKNDSLRRQFYFHPTHVPMAGIPGDYITVSGEGEVVTLHSNLPFQVQRLTVKPIDGREEQSPPYDFYLTQDITAHNTIPPLSVFFDFAEPFQSSIDFFWLHLRQPNDTTLIVTADDNPNLYFGREMQVLCVSETARCDYRASGLLRVRQLRGMNPKK